MRKYQQQQILDLLQKTKQAQSAGLYGVCKNAVSAIYDFIENIKGEGTQTAALLKDYYQTLSKANNGEIDHKDLKKHLFKIENCIKDELKPDRVEIAFLSYCASMSDSIESIYLAAKDDPNCDAYWIPIPWFERNSDGSLGPAHFEGSDCYSNDIECTDWQQYDIEARHPDVIVSFAPYDAKNYVTTVHPDFYFERLRNLTDLLVYVPYFVVDENAPLPDHFCTLPGCVYAHKVIVQSKKVRDGYIREFKKFYGNKIVNPKDKFVALGSPKFDKVINTKREDCKLPDEWRDIINGRKVIFYNTSIGTLLKYNEKYLKKLRHVLNTFKNCDDVTLWWRPHPLNESTYKAMRPYLINEYRQIIDEYKRECWGIYDDTPDLHRAIAWSDAYYGDHSSVVLLYQVTGKPIMIQNMGVLQKNKFSFNADPIMYVRHDNLSWFCHKHRNKLLLFQMDSENNKLELLEIFDQTGYHIMYMLYHRNRLFFCPTNAANIIVYDLNEKRTLFVDIPEPKIALRYDKDNKFFGIFEYDDKIYFLPATYPGILVLDSISMGTNVIDDWVQRCDELIDENPQWYLSDYRITQKGDLAYFSMGRLNAVLKLHFRKNITQLIEFNKNEEWYMSIELTENCIWMLCVNTPAIVCIDENSGICKKFIIDDYLLPDFQLSSFIRIIKYNNYIILIPYKNSQMVKFNIKSQVFTKETSFADLNYFFGRYGDDLYFKRNDTKQFFSWNLTTKEITTSRFSKTIEDIDTLIRMGVAPSIYEIQKSFKEDNVLSEMSEFLWESFISNIISKSDVGLELMSKCLKSEAGERIYLQLFNKLKCEK